MTTEEQSQGPLVGIPQAFSVAPGTTTPSGSGIEEESIRFTDPGFSLFPALTWMPRGPGLPDYTASAILQGATPAPDIDAFSCGLDWVLSDPMGTVDVPPGNWGALTFSVTSDTVGERNPNGRFGAIYAESTQGNAAADIFSYILPGSALPPDVLDIAQRAIDNIEIPISTATGDIDAHDVFVDLLWQQNPEWASLLPALMQVPRAFFSVSPATVSDVPIAWWAGTTPSAATIFCSEWTGTSWTTPVPFIVFSQLGLPASANIDAAAVDFERQRLLFSTDDPFLDPILYAQDFPQVCGLSSATLTVFPYTVDSSQVSTDFPIGVSVRIGLILRDNVDALCALDPGGDPILQRLIGRPNDQLTNPTNPPLLAGAVYRTSNNTGGSNLTMLMSGWPQPGRNQGLIVAWVAPGGPPFFLAIDLRPRDPLNKFDGDPHMFEIPLPLMPPTTIGLPLFFYGAALTPANGSLGFPFGIALTI